MLDAVESLAPYVTAVAALAVAAFTAWLAHRSWIKQFQAERFWAHREEQVRLLQEIPHKLTAVHFSSQAAFIWRTLWEAVENALSQRPSVSGDAQALAHQLNAKYSEANQALHKLQAELYVLRITARIYFGETAGKAVEKSLKALQQFSERGPENVALRKDLELGLEKLLDEEEEPSQWMNAALNQMQSTLGPMSEGVQGAIGAAVDAMAAVMRADGRPT